MSHPGPADPASAVWGDSARTDLRRPGAALALFVFSSLVVFFVFFFLLGLLARPTIADTGVGSYAYFRVTPDPRLCPSPLCGGYWLEALNEPTTTCADGSPQASCYVASADFGALEAPPAFGSGEVVVRGRIEPDDRPFFGNLGRLVVESAWVGATARSAEGLSYRIRDLGILCFVSPCFSYTAQVLNGTTLLSVSRLDLDGVGATPEQLEAAWLAAARGELLLAGQTGPDPGPAGEGLALIASQLWLPEPALPRCLSDPDCPAGSTCNAADVCLPLPACEPGNPCPTVCSGYCEPTVACVDRSDCLPDQYCASDGRCRDDGSCRLEVDCSLPGNDYVHIRCVGHGTCDPGHSCGWSCTNPLCVDLRGYDFGPCDALLGWGVLDGRCTWISGCEATPFELFASEEACRTACASTPSVPSLGGPAVFGLAIGLGASGWLLARRRLGRRSE